MPQIRDPKTGEIHTYQAGCGDLSLERNSGNDTVDQEDVINIVGHGWNLRGIANDASTSSRAEGINLDDRTDRGARAATHKQVASEFYVDFTS